MTLTKSYNFHYRNISSLLLTKTPKGTGLETIRIGLIGAGGNTKSRHIPGFNKMDGIQLLAVANRSIGSSQLIVDEFNVLETAENWKAVIEDERIDAVCIGTWPYMHCPITISALNHGKHVLCEARIAPDSQEAHAMLEASKQNPDLISQIVPAPHTLKFDKTIQKLIASNFIGDLIALDGRISLDSNFPDFSSNTHWRHSRDFSGNNIMNMGIWYEAIMRWLGPAKDVFAIGQSVVPHRVNSEGIRIPTSIPDHIDILGRFEQGGQMRLNISSVIGNIEAEVDLYLLGTKGTLRLAQKKSGEKRLYGGNNSTTELKEIFIEEKDISEWRVGEEFINAIRGKEVVTHTDFTTAVKYMDWTDGVAESLKTGHFVTLPLT